MKTQKLFLALLLFVTSSFALAQTNSFDKDAAQWHKKAVMTCGMLRDIKTFDQQKMLSNLDELSTELNALQTKYAENPPKEYANDPLWKNYFEDFADNIAIVKERVENKQYRLVSNYCGNFCRIFGRMHKNNGLTDLTDLMFSLRAEIRGAMDMYGAKNYTGAKQSLPIIRKLFNRVNAKVKAKENKEFAESFDLLNSSVKNWIEAMGKNHFVLVTENFNMFMNAFPKPYMMTL